jgi:hypothetical protein
MRTCWDETRRNGPALKGQIRVDPMNHTRTDPATLTGAERKVLI